MKKRIWILVLILSSLLIVAACQPYIEIVSNPTPGANQPSSPSEPIATTNLKIDNSPTVNEATTVPTQLENSVKTPQIWIGVIESLPAGSQFNDQFRSDTLDTDLCGIDGDTEEINKLINQYRDSNLTVSIQGVFILDIPDVNGCQIRVTSLAAE